MSYAQANRCDVMNTPIPNDPGRFKLARAEALMREALLLIDEAGESLVGSQLQHAIDSLYLTPSVATQE